MSGKGVEVLTNIHMSARDLADFGLYEDERERTEVYLPMYQFSTLE